MPVTLTVKQVPDVLAEQLRRRAAQNRRSLQRELLLILEETQQWVDIPILAPARRVSEPAHAPYRVRPTMAEPPVRKSPSRKSASTQSASGKLSLDALWRRARKLGASTPAESTAIVRRDRDARQRR